MQLFFNKNAFISIINKEYENRRNRMLLITGFVKDQCFPVISMLQRIYYKNVSMIKIACCYINPDVNPLNNQQYGIISQVYN